MSFSENGYFLASAAADGVKLWDLRKLACVREIPAPSAAFVTFDHSGLYLAVGRENVEVHAVKQDWNIVKTFSDLPKKVLYLASAECSSFCSGQKGEWCLLCLKYGGIVS